MSKERTRKSTKTTKKNQPFGMVGKVTKCDTFGKEKEHCWFILKDTLNETSYLIKKFNCTDDEWDMLCSDSELLVKFNIQYGKDKNDNLQLQLVAYLIEEAN